MLEEGDRLGMMSVVGVNEGIEGTGICDNRSHRELLYL